MKTLTQKNNITHLFLGITIVIGIVLSIIALVSIFIYTHAVLASAITGRTHIIAGDTRASGEFEGLATTPQPWEDGMRTDPTPNTFE